MSDTTLELDTVDVVDITKLEIESDSGLVTPYIVENESIIEGRKSEYSIVGDGLYASVSAEEAPQWLLSIIDSVLGSALDGSLSDLTAARDNILAAINEVDVAKNQYQELINIDATIEGIIASRLATLNATLDGNSANIVELEATKVTHDEALALSVSNLNAELLDGSIRSEITRVDTSVALLGSSTATSIEILEADYEGISGAVSTLENTVMANAESAMANFAYNATLTLDGVDYASGFGLATNLNSGTIPVGSSEFWVKADSVKFVDTLNNTVLKGDTQGLTFPSAGSIKSEGYNLTTNSGVFMGWNPANTGTNKYELLAGNGTQYMRWNGSTLDITGNITGSTITGSTFNTSISGKRVSIVGEGVTSFYRDDGIEFLTIGLQPVGVTTYGIVHIKNSMSGSYLSSGVFVDWEANANFGVLARGNTGVYGRGTDTGTVGDGDIYGVYGTGGTWDFYAGGAVATYGPFTGAHDALVDELKEYLVGDIVCDDKFMASKNISNTIFSVVVSSSKHIPAIGVLISKKSEMIPAAISRTFTNSDGEKVEMMSLPPGYKTIQFNAVGEGMLNVCGEGGNLSNGDLIVTSSMPGKGMRQNKEDGTPDGIVRNITVAKIRGNWEFSSPDEVKMIPCIYLCG